MTGRADVDTHLGRRGRKIADALESWSAPGLTPSDHAAVIESYFADAYVGVSGRLDDGTSVVAKRCRAPKGAPTVLVVGNHDVTDLTPVRATPERSFDPDELRGPGIGSRFASTVAFLEGFKAALSSEHDEPVNVHFLSVGPGESVLANLQALDLGDIDVVFCTNAIAWDPSHPTITTGSRGRIEAQITISAGQVVSDASFAGAIRNPLNKLVELLGGLRNDRGKIAIPDFYTRALPPRATDRAELAKDGFDSHAWITGLDVRQPSGSLSPLERATMWPVVSVTDLQVPDTTDSSTPATASASVAIYLVPDQRPVEIESALRAWVAEQVPSDLTATVRVTSSARPYRGSPEEPAIEAQVRAASRLQGRSAVLVPGGGTIGAGEIHYATGAPVAFAGISGPRHGFGTTDEILPRSALDLGIRQAAEICLQLPRRTALRSTT